MKRPIAISLFCGVGGMCLGFEQAGFDIPVAVEIDPIHAATHWINFPDCDVINKPVQVVSGSELVKAAGTKHIDVVFGGPPCQAFSIAGKRSPTDYRASLISDFVRLVIEIEPNYFVLENVKGLMQGKCKSVLAHAIAQFQAAGYQIRKPKVLDAQNYGVPQRRERVFLLGAKHDVHLICPHYPEPSGSVTVSEALCDIPNAEDEAWQLAEGALRYCDELSEIATFSNYAREMHCLVEGSWHKAFPRVWKSNSLTNCQTTKHSDAVRDRFAQTAPGTREAISRLDRLNADGVAPTLRAGTGSEKGRHTAPRPIHHIYPRCCTVRELARLSGFPDWFQFDPRIWHGARQIGNAVPPPLARAVAQEIYRAIQWSIRLDVN